MYFHLWKSHDFEWSKDPVSYTGSNGATGWASFAGQTEGEDVEKKESRRG